MQDVGKPVKAVYIRIEPVHKKGQTATLLHWVLSTPYNYSTRTELSPVEAGTASSADSSAMGSSKRPLQGL